MTASQVSKPEGMGDQALIDTLKRHAKGHYTKMTQKNQTSAQICVLLRRWVDRKGHSVATLLGQGTPEAIEDAKGVLSENFTRLGWK